MNKFKLALILYLTCLAGCNKSADVKETNLTQAVQSSEQKFSKYLRLAEQGDVNATFEIARMHFIGEGTPKNIESAATWFSRAAEKNNVKAQSILGWMYLQGVGTPQDDQIAFKWLNNAAAQNDAHAQAYLGWMYSLGRGVEKNDSRAIQLWEQASGQGDAYAQTMLGQRYFQGVGVKLDAVKAVDLFQKAAEQGNSDAQVSLGWAYQNGQGVPKNAVQATSWYRKAAEQGSSNGQVNLGVMYQNGQGVPADRVLAYAWYNLSASAGNQIALKNRLLIEPWLTHEQLQEAQALSSRWKPGQPIARDFAGSASTSSTTTESTPTKQGAGTGFFVNKEGQAITNHHVVQNCREVRIEGREGTVKVLVEDKVNDLALLKVSGQVQASAPIAKEPQKLRQGEDIVVFGYPLNLALSSGGNLTPGVVSALTGLGNNTSQIQITASIQPGSSGSPVINAKGEVVGVVSSKISDLKMAKATGSVGQNVNFAVNGLTLKTFLDTHKVNYKTINFLSFNKATADLADEARNWTVVVECWQ